MRLKDNTTLSRLKGELVHLWEDSISSIGQVLQKVKPLEDAFKAYEMDLDGETAMNQVMDLVPKLRNLPDFDEANEKLKQLEEWFQERDADSVTPSSDLRETLTMGRIMTVMSMQSLEKIRTGLKAANALMRRFESLADDVAKGEKVGRLAVAYFSEAGKASEEIGALGGMVVLIINIGGVND